MRGNHLRAAMATAVRAFSSAAPAAPAGGVSMVQGASRGIGLEFVSAETQPSPLPPRRPSSAPSTSHPHSVCAPNF